MEPEEPEEPDKEPEFHTELPELELENFDPELELQDEGFMTEPCASEKARRQKRAFMTKLLVAKKAYGVLLYPLSS